MFNVYLSPRKPLLLLAVSLIGGSSSIFQVGASANLVLVTNSIGIGIGIRAKLLFIFTNPIPIPLSVSFNIHLNHQIQSSCVFVTRKCKCKCECKWKCAPPNVSERENKQLKPALGLKQISLILTIPGGLSSVLLGHFSNRHSVPLPQRTQFGQAYLQEAAFHSLSLMNQDDADDPRDELILMSNGDATTLR